MTRQRNTTVAGLKFDDQTINAVWEKATIIEGEDPTDFRRDILGNLLYRGSYGKQTILGWEIDHIKPVAKGGTDDLENLQVLQSSANSKKGDNYPWP